MRRNLQAHTLSQFMHGEQGALIATSKIVQTVPNIEAKFYAATQVMDEARHVEAYARLLHEKVKLAYPITRTLALLLESTITDRRWDMTYLGMQVLIEGLALAAFQRIRDTSSNTLAAAVNAYVMQDEARHVAFGRLALRDYYPELTDAERDEREEFVVEACYHMRDRFNQPRGVGQPRPARQGMRRSGRAVRVHAALPHAPLLAHRPHRQGHRPLGSAGAEGLRGHGRDGVRHARRPGHSRQ